MDQFNSTDTIVEMTGYLLGLMAQVFLSNGTHPLFTAISCGAAVYAFASLDKSTPNRKSPKKVEESPRFLPDYHAVFNAANDAIYIHEIPTGRLLDVNQKVCELTGFTREEVLKLSPSDVCVDINPYTVEECHARLQKAIKGESQLFDWLAKDKNGNQIWVEVNLKRATIGDQDYVLAVVRDIAERKRAEEALNKRVEYERMLRQISVNAVAVENLSDYLGSCLKIMAETLGLGRVYIFEHDDQKEVFSVIDAWRSPEEKSPPLLAEIPTRLVANALKTLQSDQVVNIPCVDDWPYESEKAILQTVNIKSSLSVPMFLNGDFFGLLGFGDCTSKREWPEEDVALLRTIAYIITNTIQQKRSEDTQRMLVSAVESATDQIIVVNTAGTIEYVNPALEKETGYSLSELRGQPKSIFRCELYEESFYENMWKVVYKGDTWQGEVSSRRKDGTLCVEDVTISPVINKVGEIERIVAIKRNITEKKHYEQKLDHMAHHDPLTGLPNRLLFSDRLTQSLAQSRRDQQMMAVMFLDLDRFKVINDTLGHNVGDLLLRQVAKRLTSTLRDVDTIARMGGDEFTLIINRMHEPADAIRVAKRTLDAFSEPFMVHGRELFVTTSIGISIYPADGVDVETLVRNADASMYKAKEQGRNAFHVYTEKLNESAMERIELEHSLRKALERNEFTLHYQPRVDINTGRILGAEALVRWNHPTLGVVMPNQFIPLAEETGLILPLGKQVLKMACEQNMIWQESGLNSITVGVNISARHFQHGDLIGVVRQALCETKLDPHFLELELTESTLMHSPDIAIEVLSDLRAMGVRISIDDFGTGYSSLSYLKRFPVDAVKIDRSFVKDITTSPDDAAIAGAVIAMAHSLELKVIAEGVETLDHLRFLTSLHCDEMQGYFISRPVPAQEMAQLLRDQNTRPDMLMLSA